MCSLTSGPAFTDSTSNWPLIASVICWPPPLYGMCTICTFAAACSCSSIRWPSEAWPDVAQRVVPGQSFERPIRSRKSRAALAGVASTSTGDIITLATGVKS
jgi:hypothetical protein